MTATTVRKAIVRGERIANRGPGGGRSYAAVKGLLNYLAFGRYVDRLGSAQAQGRSAPQRASWLDHNGQEQSHDEVLGWAKEKVHRLGYGYTYQLLLSTRHGGLGSAGFNQVLKEGSVLSAVREWVYTVHEDTEHQHAHAILFRKEKLSGAEYRAWQAAMQAGLEKAIAAQERLAEAKQEPGLDGDLPADGVTGEGPGDTPGDKAVQTELQGEQETAGGRGKGLAL